jgi:formate hydrogenlyase subunit 3/multisubunit Na+/H+ antiporter MnhD subunit
MMWDLPMTAIVLAVVLPLLAAFLMQPLGRISGAAARALGPLVLVVSAWVLVDCSLRFGNAPFTVAIGGYAPPIGIVFYVDKLALLFATAVPVLTLLFWTRGEDHPDPDRRDAVMLLMAAAATGLALSGDLFNIYVFYELTAVSSFGLMTLNGTGRAYVATVRYLLLSAMGSVLALVGIALIYQQTGTLNLAQIAQLAPRTLQGPTGLAAFALLLIGFGVKGELFPVNTWVPEVYATAPARVSALLAGLISKLAVLVLVRLLVLAYQGTAAADLMLALGLVGVITAELAAWRSRDFPRMLAYSSIGQLGMVFIAFSLPGEVGVFAGVALALHHLVIKSALFSLATRWSGSLDGLAGVARAAPLAAGLFVLLALSLIGVPPLPGFWAKLLVVIGLADGGSALQMTALAAILIGAAVEASYLFRLAVRMYQAPDAGEVGTGATGGAPDAALHTSRPMRVDVGIAALAGAALLAITVAIGPAAATLRDIARQAADVQGYVETVFPETIAPSD